MTHDVHTYRALIESALARDKGASSYTFADIAQMVTSDDAQLWCGDGSVMITAVIEYPQRKVLHFFIAAGSLSAIEAMLPAIETWGKQQGCTGATLIGRPGWARTFLADRGWTRTAIVMETTL